MTVPTGVAGLAGADRGLPRRGCRSATRTPVVTLQEGNTPLLPAPELSRRTGCEVYLKVEGANPTGSFKDRGMTMAITKAVEEGAQAVICASTGNTSASAAAYAARAGITCAVLVPQGKIAMGKLAQALVHGAQLLQVEGNFDDCLALASKLAIDYPVSLVNSVNQFRIEGQKTASFEIVDVLGDAPDIHCLPVGNAGNITAYWQGYREYAADGDRHAAPRACGASRPPAPRRSSPAQVVEHPETIATAIRIGNPASWTKALDARDELRRPHRRRHRPRDPRRLPAAGPQRGGVRRAGVGRLGRRPAAGRRGRRARARPAGRLHRHRQRAQGPGVGHLRGAGAGDHPGRRRRGRRAAGPVTAPRAVRVRVPATSANLGPAFDCAGPGADAATTSSSSPSCRRAWRSSVSGVGRGGAAHRRVAPGRPRVPGRVRPSSAGRRRACAWSPTTASRRAGGWARRRPRSSPGCWAPGRCAPTSTASTTTRCSG